MDRFATSRSGRPAVQVGDPAPGFTLRASFDSTFSAPTGRPLVIAFYVFDFGAF